MRHPLPVVLKPSKQKTKRGNGRVVLDGRSARGRRHRELLRAYGEGVELLDEKAAGLVRSTAAIAIEIEAIEDTAARGEAVDHFAMARLINTRERWLHERLSDDAQRRGIRIRAIRIDH